MSTKSPSPSSRRFPRSTEELSDFAQEAIEQVPNLLAMARRLTRSAVEAEDLVQDTLVKAIRARDQFQEGTNLRAWLFKILKNTFINRYHRHRIERAATDLPMGDPVVDGWIGNATMSAMRDPEASLLRPQLEREIQAAIDELPEEFRMVVVLADVEGFAYREIADILGCPIGTVMSRLHRARRVLKARLIDHARALGLVEPEPIVGDGAEGHAAPIDLRAYRETDAKRGADARRAADGKRGTEDRNAGNE